VSLNNSTIGALVRTTVSMQYVNAGFDDVAVWERALSLGEIQQMRTNGLVTPIAARAPLLTKEPVSVTKGLGDWALFSTGAIGNRPFSYQWFKNGSPITGATNQSYQVTGLMTNNSVSVWVQGDFTGQNARRVFSEGSSTANNPLFSLGTDNANPPTTPSVTVFVRNDAGVNAELVGKKSTRAVFDNTWHHLVW